MNTWQKRSVAALAVTLLAAGGWGVAAAQADPTAPPATAPAAAPATADATLKKNLAYMREEERLARDLYKAFADKYGSDTAFARIATSEQRHMDAIGVLLTRYGIDDPSAGRTAGSFANADLQKLYDDLLAQGKQSLQDAYKAGVAVEDADIADLNTALKETTAADATRVFENLKRGSEMHLAAFTGLRDGTRTAGTGPGMMQRGEGRMGQGDGQGMGRMGQGRGTGPVAPADRPADCPLR